MKTVKLLFFLFISLNSFAQQFELRGTVMDSETNEKLGGVHVQLINQNQSNNYFAITKLNGDFIIRGIEKGEYQILTSYIGYINSTDELSISSNQTKDIQVDKELIDIGEVIVSSMRQEIKIKDVPVPIEIVDKKQIERSSSFTASDVLAQEPGVAMASDGVWATGINIRGLSQQRIVMLVDGNRIETATDLMASMSFFDVDDIERIEVIKGASSSLYGTGAMGGIVNVITNEAYFNSSTYFNGSFKGGYSSVNELFTRKVSFKSGSKNWYASLSGALRDANDVSTPEGTIPNSQFEDKSVSASFGLKLKENHTLKLKYQYFDADNVGIPGGAALPGPSTATYTDAKRQMFSANYEIKDISESFKKLNVRYFHQYIVRDVDLTPNISTTTPTSITTPELFTPSGEHTTDGAQIQTDWSFSDNNNFIAGVDVWRRKLETSREKYIRMDVLDINGDIAATNNIVRGETPIPESCFGSVGLYLQNEQSFLDDDLKLIIGGRLDGIRIANEQAFDYDYLIMNGTRNDSPPNQRITFDENEEYKLSWSANLGILYALTDDMDLSVNTGRSFRAPSLEESFKYIDLGSKVRLGDPNLDPEKGYSLDIGMRVWKPKFQFKVNGFVNWLSDMIVEESGEFIYSYTTGAVDTIPALINANVDEARLYGADLSFQYNFYKNFVVHGAGSYVRGEDTKNKIDLPLITPANGRVGIRYNLPKYFGVDLVAIGFADQDKVAEGETETKGFARFDLKLNSTVINFDFLKLQFFGGIENIGDRAYTNHLATNRGAISIEPGRNYYIKMKILF
ncbi:MAG: TonB-dependent receptor [Bacteroidales bacterium]|nr:TonB-dependent receptor [Bacteroidales bacterium]